MYWIPPFQAHLQNLTRQLQLLLNRLITIGVGRNMQFNLFGVNLAEIFIQALGHIRLVNDFGLKIQPRIETQIFVAITRITVNTAMLTTTIWINGMHGAQVGRCNIVDNCFAFVRNVLGRNLFWNIFGKNIVQKRVSMHRFKAVGWRMGSSTTFHRVLLRLALTNLPLAGFGQERHPIRAGIAAGLTLSQVDGDRFAGYHKAGVWVSLEGFVPLRERLWFVVGIAYSQRGSRNVPKAGIGTYYLLRLDYADVTLALRYEDVGKMVFVAGLTAGRLVRFQEIIDGNTSQYAENPYRPMDFLFTGELRYQVKTRWFPGIRFMYSLRSIRKWMPPNSPVPWQRNRTLTFLVSYRF